MSQPEFDGERVATSATPVAPPTIKPRGNLEAAWSPAAVHVLAKPTGAICNLGCSYCFFLDKELLYEGDRFRMSDEGLERYIVQLIEAHHSSDVTFAWQGGEPTLMGVDFYRRAIEIAEQHRRPGMRFHHTMQTNATLLDDEWCEFLAEHDFLMGISIDGPRHLHDVYRMDKRGGGTFDKVMRGLRLVQQRGVEYNVLTTVNRANSHHPLEVYRFLRDEVGTRWMQFIPVVERVDEHGATADLRGSFASERSVRPDQFGTFLSTIFDEWVHHDVGRIYVQTFEATVRNFAGLQSGMCVFNSTCGAGVALEHNGDLYSCDHFVDPEYLLGNLADASIGGLVSSRRQYDFGVDKQESLPRFCLECDVRFACHGECPKNRFLATPDGAPGLNYLCAGFQHFFHHVDRPARMIVDLMKSGRDASDVMQQLADEQREIQRALKRAGRNASCPCGSGRKIKHCHGARQSPTRDVEKADGTASSEGPRPAVTDRGRKAAARRAPAPP